VPVLDTQKAVAVLIFPPQPGSQIAKPPNSLVLNSFQITPIRKFKMVCDMLSKWP
jgi:hypothetical protein